MQCVSCSSEDFTEKDVLISSEVGDEIIEVIAPAFVCSACNDTLMSSDQMNVLIKAVKKRMK